MGRFDDIRGDGRFSDLKPLSKAELEQLAVDHHPLPEDYVAFLAEVGSGEIGPGSLMLYGGPMAPADIYDPETAEDFSHLVIFGDDFTGSCFAFDPRAAWQIVEIDSADGTTRFVATNFSEFVRRSLDDIG